MSSVKEKIVRELHKPARKNFERRRTVSKGIDDIWQADLVEMLPYAKFNKGFKYVLTVLDTLSKFAFAEPVKTKSGADVSKAMEKIFKSGRVPKYLQTDHGKEFYNSNFSNLMKKFQMKHYSTFFLI